MRFAMWMMGLSLMGHSISGHYHNSLQATVISDAPSTGIQIELSGSIENGAFVLPVVVTQDVGGHLVTLKGNAMLDTGDQMALTIDGPALEAVGGVPSNSATIYGFGGSSRVWQYADISVAPAQLPDAPFGSDIMAYLFVSSCRSDLHAICSPLRSRV